ASPFFASFPTRRSSDLYVPSLGLGSIGVSPLDQASAYATIAGGGIYSEPIAIREVKFADGNVDKDSGWGKSHRHRVVPDWVAARSAEHTSELQSRGQPA